MKTECFVNLSKGHKLLLKPDRAAAYGIANRAVIFSHIQARNGYSRPFIVASYQVSNEGDYGKVGHFTPSDFKSKA